jgi:hypothetical protein
LWCCAAAIPTGASSGASARAATATVCLALLEPLISATGVVLVTACWAAAAAVVAAGLTWRVPSRLRDLAANPLSYFGTAADDPPAE